MNPLAKTFFATLGAIALTTGPATAADFSKFGIQVETNPCQSIDPSMHLKLRKVKVLACMEQEVIEQKVYKALDTICKYGSAKDCQEKTLLAYGIILQSRSNVMLEVSLAHRKLVLGY